MRPSLVAPVATVAVSPEAEELERLRKIFDGAPIGLMRLDAEGRVVDANAAMEQLLGYSAAELGTLGVEDITHPQDLGRCVALYGEIVDGLRDTYDIEKRYLRKDRRLVWARARAAVVERDDTGRPVFTVMMAEDIGERKRAELALRRNDELLQLIESLKQFETIFASIPIGLVRLDRSGTIAKANAAFARMAGYPLVELEGKAFEAVAMPADAAGDAPVRELAGKSEGFSGERRYVRRDGTVITCHLTAAAIDRDESGDPQATIVMLEDISERRAAEEQLHQSQKIEAVGQLAAGIAHEFNNLMMGVLGYAGLSRSEVEHGTKLEHYLLQIEATTERAATLTSQLLAFARQQTLRPQEIDLNAFISDTLSMVSRLLGEHIEISMQLDDALPSLRADPAHIQQVLLNLALNARDAMPRGGRLVIRTEAATFAEAAPSLDLAPGTYVVLSVADDGCGMDAAVAARIFEPFFTTKEVGEGSGLGLATVYGIVKQTGGDIGVETAPGNGTTLRLYLPAAAAA
jgi:two-component system, cell cycle sensor histidine kinase and response regulator CckA